MEGTACSSVVRGGISSSYTAVSAGAADAAIVVFARLPVPGRVKTRLAAGDGVGPGGACEFYRACAHHAIHQAASCHEWADASVYHSSADATADVAAWLAGEELNVQCVPQLGSSSGDPTAVAPEPDLGAKMLAAMTEARSRIGLTAKVIIIGTDIPDISRELLRRAADALDEHEMVIGPSLDGGYYLLGLTRLEPRLFEGMRWSTDSVLAETLTRAASTGLRVAPLATLPRLRDVDTVEDLVEWVASRGATLEQPGTQQRQGQGARGASGGAGMASEGGFDKRLREGGVGTAVPLPAADGSDQLGLQRQRHLLDVSQRVLQRAAVVVAAAATAGVLTTAAAAPAGCGTEDQGGS